MNNSIISTHELKKYYTVGENTVKALDGVNITINKGEFICIAGRSGSGKSTLLNMLAGLELPTSGTVQVAGKRLESMNEKARIRFRRDDIGFVFQSYNLMPQYTALENVALPLAIRGAPLKLRNEIAEAMLVRVGLKEHIHHKPGELSGGQQQRVGIARAIITRPPIVLADEPTGNLDTGTSEETMELLTGLFRERGTTFILVSHDPGMRKYTDRTITFSDGRISNTLICGVCGHAMQRDNKKNGSYRCVTKRLNTGFDCSEERVPEADILEAVVDAIQVYAQYAVSIDRLLQTRQEQRQRDRKQAQRQLQTLQSRKARLDKRLQDLYEGLVEGEISRESFAAQKKALTAQAEEISRTVLELERKISGSDDGSNAVIEQFKSYAGITALTREISIELLQSVTIYPDGRMDIRLNLADEIKALMETLHRESCTA